MEDLGSLNASTENVIDTASASRSSSSSTELDACQFRDPCIASGIAPLGFLRDNEDVMARRRLGLDSSQG
jgi:hypothetical protein